MSTKLHLRGDTGANWQLLNPILPDRFIGIEQDAVDLKFKFGDGTTRWNDLEFKISGSTASGTGNSYFPGGW